MKRSPLALCALLATAPSSPGADYAAMIPSLEAIIHDEMTEWGIGGVAVALVEDQRVVYAAGFGEAKRDSIFRVGSVSKLFNAMAVMQQVEAGRLDLDAPLPAELLPLNPFPGEPAVTLRQLLCHRSGLQRESIVGGYFDASEPALAATVASVRPCVLVTRPGEKTRYSNLGPSIAGRLVEQVSDQSFEAYQQEHILQPLGMTNSAWTLARAARARIVVSHMRIADGHGGWKRRKSPLFDLGTIPAGNLFSSAEDLGRFAAALMAGGAGLVKPETLREMWRPQLTKDDTGFGLGFSVGKVRGRRTIGHSGAVYGFSTSLVVLPEEKLAVIVLSNEDIVGGRMHRISDAALSLLLEARFGEKPPRAGRAGAPTREELARLAGDYESQSYWARLAARGDGLVGEVSGQPTKFTAEGGFKFAAHSRLDDATPVVFERNAAGEIKGFTMGVQQFVRVPSRRVPLPKAWRAFLGSYGPDFIPLVVSERYGHLYAMTENMVDYRLTPLNLNVCTLPAGMYVDEQVVFLTGRDGRARSVNFANMGLRRR